MSKCAKKSCQSCLYGLLAAVVVLILFIGALVSTFLGHSSPESLDPEAVASRIAPVAQYNTGAVVAEPVATGPLTGEQVYKRVCMTCHDAGLAGAPKLGDAAGWAPRIANGAAAVYHNAIHGIGGMPARGGNAALSDLEVKRAVAYIVNLSGGQFDELTEE